MAPLGTENETSSAIRDTEATTPHEDELRKQETAQRNIQTELEAELNTTAATAVSKKQPSAPKKSGVVKRVRTYQDDVARALGKKPEPTQQKTSAPISISKPQATLRVSHTSAPSHPFVKKESPVAAPASRELPKKITAPLAAPATLTTKPLRQLIKELPTPPTQKLPAPPPQPAPPATAQQPVVDARKTEIAALAEQVTGTPKQAVPMHTPPKDDHHSIVKRIRTYQHDVEQALGQKGGSSEDRAALEELHAKQQGAKAEKAPTPADTEHLKQDAPLSQVPFITPKTPTHRAALIPNEEDIGIAPQGRGAVAGPAPDWEKPRENITIPKQKKKDFIATIPFKREYAPDGANALIPGDEDMVVAPRGRGAVDALIPQWETSDTKPAPKPQPKQDSTPIIPTKGEYAPEGTEALIPSDGDISVAPQGRGAVEMPTPRWKNIEESNTPEEPVDEGFIKTKPLRSNDEPTPYAAHWYAAKEKRAERSAEQPNPEVELRTYKIDVAETVKKQGETKTTIAAKEHRKQEQFAPPKSHAVRSTIKISLIGGTLLGVGLGAFFVFLNARPEAPTQPTIPGLIAAQSTANTVIADNRSATLTSLANEIAAAQIASGNIHIITPTHADGSPMFTQEFLEHINARAPASFLRTLQPRFTLGAYGTETGNVPFLILKTNQYDAAFGGMLAWETTLSNDLSPLFGEPLVYNAAQNTARTQSGFTDAVVQNYDVRVFRIGADAVLYSFPDRQTIVITTNESALLEVLTLLSIAGT